LRPLSPRRPQKRAATTAGLHLLACHLLACHLLACHPLACHPLACHLLSAVCKAISANLDTF
jgi:hypothetical protein